MTAPQLSARQREGSAIFQIGAVAVLAVIQLVWALRGHPVEWFRWTLLLLIAAGGADRLAAGSEWRLPVRIVSAIAAVATIAGLALAYLHGRAA